MGPVLIAGCGDIGTRVAALCRDRGLDVAALVRRSERARSLAGRGLTVISADLDQPGALESLPTAGRTVFYLVPPPGEGDRDPRLARFLEAAGSRLPERVVYVSTSAVYGDAGGAWIDEDAPLKPATARGRRRLDAETRLLAWGARTGVAVVILRVPGIYGPGRLPLKRLEQGLPVVRAEQSAYTNRIHADDLAAVCVEAAARGRPGAAYNVSDGHPTTMADYFNRVADLAGLPRPPAVSMAEARRVLSSGMLSFLSESKRLDNRRMLEELGVRLRYPDLAAGLPSCLEGSASG